jgi:hypothetical protein
MENMTNNTSNTQASTQEAAAPPPVTTPPAIVPTSGNARVAINFATTDTDAELIVDSDRIYTAMSGNKAFPTPIPSLAELFAARTAFVAAVNAAQDSVIARSTRRAHRTSFVVLLRKLAHYVQMTSAGDRTTLLSSGFRAQRRPAPVGVLLPPTALVVVRAKTSGNVIVRCKRHAQAGAYQWRIGPTASPMLWLPVETTLAAHANFEGLQLYTQYTAQVRAIGTAGPSDWSDIATAVVV